MGLYYSRLVRSMYRLGENTYLIRNELGDYYLREQNYPGAIRQYKQVLAIDPWDIETIYDLGTIYEWSGDWKQAMNNYQRVYWSDPLYENVGARYNQLARQHADSLEVEASTFSDGNRIEYQGDISYNTLVNSILGLEFSYSASNIRIYDVDEIPSNTLVHDVGLAVALDFSGGKLKFVPRIGVQVLNDLYWKTRSETGITNFAGSLGAEPGAGLDFGLALGQYLYLNGGYSWGRQEETLSPGRSRIFSHKADLNLSTSLSFIKAYPFRYSALRTYGKAEYLSTLQFTEENYMYTLAQEMTIGVLRKEEPYVELNLLGNFIYEDSGRPESDDYYTPIGVMVAGGGLSTSAWIPLGESTTLNLGLRGLVGWYGEKIRTSVEIRRIQLEVEGTLGFSKGEAYYYLRPVFTTTYKYEEAGGETSDWDYWSLAVLLGFTTNLPQLLAP
jgi:tetratricopeptide (TPR) repeat protein